MSKGDALEETLIDSETNESQYPQHVPRYVKILRYTFFGTFFIFNLVAIALTLGYGVSKAEPQFFVLASATMTIFIINGALMNWLRQGKFDEPATRKKILWATIFLAVAMTANDAALLGHIYRKTYKYYIVGGSVTNIIGTAIKVQNTGESSVDTINVAPGTCQPFVFPTRIKSGESYRAAISTQPSQSQCLASTTSASGIVTADTTPIRITCTATFTIGGLLKGLKQDPVTLLLNGGNSYQVTANGQFTFPTRVQQGTSYTVTIGANPVDVTGCSVTAGTGQVSGNINGVEVSCA